MNQVVFPALALFLFASCLDSASVHAKGPSRHDSVTGGGTFPLLMVSNGEVRGVAQGNVAAGAKSGPNGKFPWGAVRVRTAGAASTVKVEGVCVDGNRAVVGGPIRAGDEAAAIYIAVVDNGREDLISGVIIFGSPLPCEVIFSLIFDFGAFPPFPLAHGNFHVRDAP